MARQPFNTRWAQGVESEDNLNTFKDPGDVRVTTGWEGGQDKDAPPAGQENWWHNRVDTALQGVERSGVMDWHPQAQYKIGAPTMATDGNYYESLAFPNVGNNPLSTSGFWRFIGSSFFSNYDPGDIKTVAHNNTPSLGWLKCNGAVLLRASYQRLFAVIGTTHNTGGETPLQFRLPDYRGEFLRGFDDLRGVDSGRQFGSFQADSLQGHAHFIGAPEGQAGNGIGATTRSLNPVNTFPGGAQVQEYRSDGLNGSPRVSTETRGRNKSVNYWIRYQ